MQITYVYIIDYDASIIELKSILKMVGIGQDEKDKAYEAQKDE